MQLSKDEKLYHQSQISFFSAIFQGIASKLFKLSSSCFFGYYTHRKEEEASSIVKGKEPGRRFIKQALGHWKEHASVSSPGDLEEVRLEQIKELYTLNGTSWTCQVPKLSYQILDDSSIERTVIGKCSLKSLVILETLEKMRMINLRNNGKLRGQVKDVFKSQKGCHGEEVEDLFSEALEHRPEWMRRKRSREADFG